MVCWMVDGWIEMVVEIEMNGHGWMDRDGWRDRDGWMAKDVFGWVGRDG